MLKLFNDHVLKPKDQRGRTSSSDNASASKPKTYSTPIIIIPNALTSIVTLANIQSFLADGEYVAVDVKGGASAPGELTIHHRQSGVSCDFRVMDNVSKLNERLELWDRVVAVFATGQPWQFKNWKWSEPVNLFQNVLGVHLMFSDSEINPNVQSWNCKVLKVRLYSTYMTACAHVYHSQISRTQRHLDAGAMNQFWNMLHDFIELNKPWLDKRVANKGRA